jgi:hypothetical protein
MPLTITLSFQDEEHIILLEPGDNLIDLLTNTLGDLNNYTFSINGEDITPVSDLEKRVHDGIIIDVAHYIRGIASLLMGPRGYPLEITSVKNPNRPTIKIETVHISCSSDSYTPSKNMTGFIVYSFDDQLKFELNGHRCRTGYILIKETENIDHVKSNQGLVHGKLFKWFFGIEPDQRFIGGGFAFHDGKLKFNSGVFNARNDDYHDGVKSMHQHEIHLINYAMKALYKNNAWRQNPTISVNVIDRKNSVRWESLPSANQPKKIP